MDIQVEMLPLRKSRLVPQCKRCQAYGHTQKYCAKQPRCVRCTGKHHTKDCNKSKNEQPKCVHCGEAHPANFKGCIVTKEMQKIKNKQIKKTNLPFQPQRNSQEVVNGRTDAMKSNITKSYSQAVKGKLEGNINSRE